MPILYDWSLGAWNFILLIGLQQKSVAFYFRLHRRSLCTMEMRIKGTARFIESTPQLFLLRAQGYLDYLESRLSRHPCPRYPGVAI